MAPTLQMSNKDALDSYVKLFPPILKAIRDRNMRDAAEKKAGTVDPLVGFGVHHLMTRSALYDSQLPEHVSYRKHIATVKNVHPGSKLDLFQKYLTQRQTEDERDGASLSHRLMRQTSRASATSNLRDIVATYTARTPVLDEATDATDEELLACYKHFFKADSGKFNILNYNFKYNI